MDQHYLPECYLKSFATNNGKFFSIDLNLVKFGKTPYPQEKSPAMVCYRPNFYTVKENQDIFENLDNVDPLILEKAFHDYEKNFGNILRPIFERHGILSLAQAQRFIYILVDLKIRNEYFRKNVIETRHPQVIKDTFAKYLPENEQEREVLAEVFGHHPFIQIMENVKERLLNDENFPKRAHLSSLLKRKQVNAELYDRITSNLLFFPWVIFESADGFFTSDNPGYSLDPNNIVYNTKFDRDFAFIFPLSPCQCLCIMDKKIDLEYYDNLTQKKLHYQAADEEMCRRFNTMIMRHPNKYIFSPNKTLLADFAKDIRYTP